MSQLIVNCPDAIHKKRTGKSDEKQKLYIYCDTNTAFCFRCKFFTKNAKEVLAKYGIKVQSSTFARPRVGQTYHRRLSLPGSYSNTFRGMDGEQALRYLISRNISAGTIAAYDVGYCARSGDKYSGRVIIPIYEDGVLVNFQARDYTGEQEPRYTGPSSKDGARANCLFNLERPANSGVLFLVEGPMDALRMPEFAVSLLGSGWNDTKRNKILSVKPTTIILCLDNDAAGQEAKRQVYKDLYGLVPHLSEFRLSQKDLGSVLPEELEAARQFCIQAARAT